MNGLAGKVALVTGAGSLAGIGYASARRLASEGAKVLLTDIDESGISRSAAALSGDGRDVMGMAQDVTVEANWTAAVQAAVERFGRLDILVNNAGIAVLGDVEKLTLDDWRRQIDVNLTSIFLGCRVAVSQFRKQGGGGAIVNISSVAGLIGMPGTAAYAASKGGVRLMTKSLALDGAKDGVRVNSVHPGMIETDIQKIAEQDNPGVSAIIAATIPMKALGRPEDIAAMVAFLASLDAAYITGAEFVVDGGLTAQ